MRIRSESPGGILSKTIEPGTEEHQNFRNRNATNSCVARVAMAKVERVKEKDPELAEQK